MGVDECCHMRVSTEQHMHDERFYKKGSLFAGPPADSAHSVYIQDEIVQVICHLGIHIYTLVRAYVKMFWSAAVLPAYYLLSVLQSTVTVVKHSFGV